MLPVKLPALQEMLIEVLKGRKMAYAKNSNLHKENKNNEEEICKVK